MMRGGYDCCLVKFTSKLLSLLVALVTFKCVCGWATSFQYLVQLHLLHDLASMLAKRARVACARRRRLFHVRVTLLFIIVDDFVEDGQGEGARYLLLALLCHGILPVLIPLSLHHLLALWRLWKHGLIYRRLMTALLSNQELRRPFIDTLAWLHIIHQVDHSYLFIVRFAT